MRLHVSTMTRRALGIAFATTMVASGLTAAASPAGDALDADYRFRDEGRTAVLAVYPYSDGASPIGYFRVRGPKVSWIDSHPLPSGSVGWRVIVKTGPTKHGPWTLDSRTGYKHVVADRTGKLETFKARTVSLDNQHDRFLKVVSRLVWYNEDGGRIAWASHAYTRYGMVESTGLLPRFGDESVTRYGAVPRSWTH